MERATNTTYNQYIMVMVSWGWYPVYHRYVLAMYDTHISTFTFTGT